MKNVKNLMLSILTAFLMVVVTDTVAAQSNAPVPGTNMAPGEVRNGWVCLTCGNQTKTKKVTEDELKKAGVKTGSKATIPQVGKSIHIGMFDRAIDETKVPGALPKKGTATPDNIQAKRKYKINEKKECKPFKRKY